MYIYDIYTNVYMLIVLFHVEHPTAKISGPAIDTYDRVRPYRNETCRLLD